MDDRENANDDDDDDDEEEGELAEGGSGVTCASRCKSSSGFLLSCMHNIRCMCVLIALCCIVRTYVLDGVKLLALASCLKNVWYIILGSGEWISS